MAQKTYKIQAGDTLSKVASTYGVKIGDITGYASGDPNKIQAGETVSFNTPDMPPANTIDAANLNATPLTPPPDVPKTGRQKLIDSTNAVLTDLTPKVEKGEKDIQGIYDKLGKKRTERADAYEDEGVYTKKKAYNDIVNQINAKDLASRRAIEKIQNENSTGQLSEGQRIAIDREQKMWSSEKADMAIAAAFAKDDYELARTIVDDRIQAETEDLTTELAGLQFFYSQNYNKLSDAQKTLLQQETNQIENEIADKKELLSQVGAIQLEAAANGAPVSTITAIGKAPDMTSAIGAAGKYIGLYDRMAEERLGGGGSGSGIKFSDTQLANGAANAGVQLSEFNTYDEDTKNFFINGDISGTKADIDQAFKDGSSIDDVKASIQEAGLPAAGQQYLLQYADQAGANYRIPTQEEIDGEIESTLTSLKEQEYTRGEAFDTVLSAFTSDEDGKAIEIAGSQKKKLENSIKDALVKVYGRTFWQSVLPGGR